ncbi:MAG TPA: Flp pilus assembly protein CpaB [Geminicoccaceae bacterium]|nr:Flp pilus assembly protein CpaB [Geminicoccaceae bacterium]
MGFLLAGGSVVVAHSYLRGAATQSPGAQAREIGAIAVARTDIPFGAPIHIELVRLQEWPKEALPPEAFTTLEELLGPDQRQPRRARRSIVAGEPIVRNKVSDFGEKVTISDIIDPGKRAMAIRVNDVSGVAGFVTPGDRIDVLLTRRLDNDNMTTTTVLQDIVVRGTDQLADEDLDKPNVARTVTVEVTPDEAQRLALAQQAGTLGLTLRNVATTEKPALQSLSVSDLSSAPGKSKASRQAPTVTVNRAGERSAVAVRGD